MRALLVPSMDNNSSSMIDMQLVDDVVMAIPDDCWDKVKAKFVEEIVNEMPSEILQALTGSSDDKSYAKAETILAEYYEPDTGCIEIIVDAMKLIGPEQTLYNLDLLQLTPVEQLDVAISAVDD